MSTPKAPEAEDRFEFPAAGKVVVYNHTDNTVNEIVLCLRVHIEPHGSVVLPVAKARELCRRLDYLTLDPVEKAPAYSPEEIARAKKLAKPDMLALLEGLMMGQRPPLPLVEDSPEAMEKGKL